MLGKHTLNRTQETERQPEQSGWRDDGGGRSAAAADGAAVPRLPRLLAA